MLVLAKYAIAAYSHITSIPNRWMKLASVSSLLLLPWKHSHQLWFLQHIFVFDLRVLTTWTDSWLDGQTMQYIFIHWPDIQK